MCPKQCGSVPYHINDCMTIGETTGDSESKEGKLRLHAPDWGSSVEEDSTIGCTGQRRLAVIQESLQRKRTTKRLFFFLLMIENKIVQQTPFVAPATVFYLRARSPMTAMMTPQPSLCGCWPAIQPPHAMAATAATSAVFSNPLHIHSGPLFAQSIALRETLLSRRFGRDWF